MFWVKGLVAGLAVALTLGLVSADEDKKTDKDKIQGEWKVVSATVGGKDVSDKLAKSMAFKGDKITTVGEGTFKLDPAKDPKHIDFDLTEGPHVGLFPGVYKLDGDDLTIHLAHPGSERPGGFESQEKMILFKLERVKK